MKNLKFSAAVAALMAVIAVSSAQAQQLAISTDQPLAPAPGTIVKVGSTNCLMANATDKTAWCQDLGKTQMPACANPVVINRELLCADGQARRK
ncbi:MAG: hypothetical protein Q7R90_01810 [bacterium]|nr:hypothetical protein [bacterium]